LYLPYIMAGNDVVMGWVKGNKVYASLSGNRPQNMATIGAYYRKGK
jgi:hypothetical protein